MQNIVVNIVATVNALHDVFDQDILDSLEAKIF